MQLSRFGQGLAVSAVSALAITGLAVIAPPALAADGSGVRLISQSDAIASVRRDAGIPVGLTVTLAAEQTAPDAVISFEYNADPTAGDGAAGWTAISPAMFPPPANLPRYRTIDWTPDPALVGTSVALRAVATTPTTTTYSTRNGVALSGDESPIHAVSLGTSDFFSSSSPVGPFFVQPYLDSSRTASLLRVYGTTSATEGAVQLSAWNAEAGTFQGRIDAAVNRFPLKTGFPGGPGMAPFVDGGRFVGALDISAFDADAGDVLAVRAVRDSDSVFPAQLQAQTITSIASSLPLNAGRENTVVTLRVADQFGYPVVGAEVRRSSDGTLVGYTDAEGQATVTQANSTSATYYANTTDTDAFEDGIDVVTGEIATPAYVPVTSGTEAVLADGTVFDDQEYADGDIALQVVDQEGDPFAGEQEISYQLTPTGEEPSDPTTVTTDADGRAVVPFDPAGPDGEYTLTFTAPPAAGGAEQEPVTFVAGDAVLGLTPTAGSAPSGGQITYAGTLTVEGEPLVGRAIDLGYTRGNEQAPGTEADAGILVGGERTLAGELTTGSAGTFTVKVGDLAETGNPVETGGKLRVTARGLGDTIDATADFARVATSTKAVLADGAVFDDREYAAGDIALQVVDQEGAAIAGAEEVSYRLARTGQEPPAYTAATTDANGRLVVPFDPAGADGEYTLTFTAPGSTGSDAVQSATFVAGDAVLALTPVQGKAASGAEITYAGSLTVAGKPLAGRAIDLGYARGTELAPGSEADAALVIGGARVLTGAVTTKADGTFAVTVDDLVETGDPSETGGRLSVTARGLQDTVGATADFGSGQTAARIRLFGSNSTTRIDRLRVAGRASLAGETIRVYAKVGGRWRAVKSRELNGSGDATVAVRDQNGSRITRYYVKLVSSLTTGGAKSNVRKLR